MTEAPAWVHVVVGPERHGVVQHALAVAGDTPVVRAQTPADLSDALGACHVHFTDGLWGPTAPAAAQRFRDVLRDKAFTLTCHDLPQPADGPGRFERRRAAYTELTSRARGVIVASAFEAALVEGCADVRVIGLPMAQPAAGPPPPRTDGPLVVGLCGFVYPGKGYERVIAAAPPGTVVRLIGTPSAGHEGLVAELIAAGAARGVTVEITGYLPHDRLIAELRAVDVPLAAHRHISASGSVNAWLEAGRRPFVPDHPYLREVAARNPFALNPYTECGDAIAAAAADRAATWLPPGCRLAPTLTEVRADYRQAIDAFHGVPA